MKQFCVGLNLLKATRHFMSNTLIMHFYQIKKMSSVQTGHMIYVSHPLLAQLILTPVINTFFSRGNFQMHFLDRKCMNFDYDIIDICS